MQSENISRIKKAIRKITLPTRWKFKKGRGKDQGNNLKRGRKNGVLK